MIAVCCSVAAIGAMTYEQAYRSPLALLYQIHHFAQCFHGATCRRQTEPMKEPITARVAMAASQWRTTVDTLDSIETWPN